MAYQKIKYYDDVYEATAPLRRFLKGNIVNGSRFETDEFENYCSGNLDSSHAHLRLDFELTDESRVDTASVGALLCQQISGDIADLLENGDVENSKDYLYKTLDGSKKRNAEPVNVRFISAVYYSEYKSKKESTEYTLFVILATDWIDN